MGKTICNRLFNCKIALVFHSLFSVTAFSLRQHSTQQAYLAGAYGGGYDKQFATFFQF